VQRNAERMHREWFDGKVFSSEELTAHAPWQGPIWDTDDMGRVPRAPCSD
jgi:hypothetical protein